MTWRLSPLPHDWQRTRRRILERDDYTCQISAVGCEGVANEVDHIGDRNDHTDANLRAACYHCHKRRTYEQSLKREPRRRPPEAHPGTRN